MPDRRRFLPERKANMFNEIKWMIIDFLIRHNVLAVERVRADRGYAHGRRAYRS